MSLKIWVCVAALVAVTLGVPTTNVPNLCPAVPGAYPTFYAHPGDCQYYFMCSNGVPHLMPCADGSRWSDTFKTCVQFNSHYDTCTRENAERECSRGAADLIPHPTACQRYYNCSDTAPRSWRSYFGHYEDECSYPDLFDVVEKKCKPYKQAYCGPYRVAAKNPCEYLKSLCGGAHCQQCSSRLPSCVGKSDGNHEHPERRWTPYFIECVDDRLVGPGLQYCDTHSPTGHSALFSPDKKECVSLWEVPRERGGLAPTCDGKPPGQSYRSDERPDVYYSCPGAAVFYCGVGSVFNENSQQCEASN